MLQNSLAINIAKRNRIYYGWVITAVASLGIFFSGPGQTYFFSAFIDSYIKDFNWNRSVISSLYSIATLMAGFLLFVVGRLADRYGQKKLTIIVAAILGAACMWNSFISGLWMLFAGFFIGRLTGQGSMTLLPSTIIPQWFIKRRAFAFSMMSIGGVIGSTVLPPINIWLIAAWGWNSVWRLWALLLWFFFIPVVYLLLHDKPEDIGLLPDNGVFDMAEQRDSVEQRVEDSSWTLKEAMRNKSFWGMLYCQILLPMIGTGITFHFISIMGTKGLSASSTAFILSLLSVVSFPTTFLAGFLLDRVKMHHAAAFISALQVISLGILLYSSNVYSAIVFAAVLGSAMGFSSVFGGIVWPNYYGMKHLGSIRGLAMTVTVVGSALGPIPFGFAFDMFGSYDRTIILMMLFPAAGIAAALLSSKPIKKH